MRQTRKNGLIMTLIAIVAIMAMGTTAVAAGIGGTGTDLPFFAQNGNGNGGRSGENPPHRPGTGNNGQGQGAEHGNPPEDPGSGNNRQDGGQDEGESEDEVVVPDGAEDTGDEATDDAVETDAEDGDTGEEQVNAAAAKLEICHVTGDGGVLISISSRALPAHLRHGDTEVGNTAEGTCGDTVEAENAALAPNASPAAGVNDTADDEDTTEAGTPAASPMASPMASPEAGEDND